jgi:hypothetical protein
LPISGAAHQGIEALLETVWQDMHDDRQPDGESP